MKIVTYYHALCPASRDKKAAAGLSLRRLDGRVCWIASAPTRAFGFGLWQEPPFEVPSEVADRKGSPRLCNLQVTAPEKPPNVMEQGPSFLSRTPARPTRLECRAALEEGRPLNPPAIADPVGKKKYIPAFFLCRVDIFGEKKGGGEQSSPPYMHLSGTGICRTVSAETY